MVSAEGNNNLLYLPLDQLARESGANRSKRRSGSESVRVELEEEDLRKVADQVLQQLQRSSGPVRGREGRSWHIVDFGSWGWCWWHSGWPATASTSSCRPSVPCCCSLARWSTPMSSRGCTSSGPGLIRCASSMAAS